MEPAKPSIRMVAGLRALHQLRDQPPIFDDPLALAILGADERARLLAQSGGNDDPLAKGLRIVLAVRSRFAEDAWAQAEGTGVRQYVILGAGLDTYAYRHPAGASQVFEVDLPGAQARKRQALHNAGIAAPPAVRFVAVDFETDDLGAALSRAGFDHAAPAFFSWLGVVPYLDEAAVFKTLRAIAACAPGSAVVFDYIVEPSLWTPMERMGMELFAAQLAAGGEPLKTFPHPAQLTAQVRELGFRDAADITPEQLNEHYLKDRTDGARIGNVSRLLQATV